MKELEWVVLEYEEFSHLEHRSSVAAKRDDALLIALNAARYA